MPEKPTTASGYWNYRAIRSVVGAQVTIVGQTMRKQCAQSIIAAQIERPGFLSLLVAFKRLQ
jgi:hypothetical protein